MGIVVGCRGGPGTNDPALYTCQNISLSNLVTMAYRVAYYQLSAPDWAGMARFDLRAKVPATILPVYCGESPTHADAVRHPERHTYVVIGEPLPPDTPLSKIRAAVAALGT